RRPWRTSGRRGSTADEKILRLAGRCAVPCSRRGARALPGWSGKARAGGAGGVDEDVRGVFAEVSRAGGRFTTHAEARASRRLGQEADGVSGGRQRPGDTREFG